MPALASSLEEFPTLPWPELSPSIGFLLAVLLMAAGLHFRVIEVVGFGGLGIVACLIGAAVLEFRADRAAERRGDQGGAMGMLHASSDWPAIGRSRRRRG